MTPDPHPRSAEESKRRMDEWRAGGRELPPLKEYLLGPGGKLIEQITEMSITTQREHRGHAYWLGMPCGSHD